MESIYRTWIHAKKDASGLWDLNELRRDLQTTLGTTKWQLDEFERAVKSSYPRCSSAEDTKHRTPPSSTNKTTLKVRDKDVGVEKLKEGDQQLMTECLKPSFQLVGWGLGSRCKVSRVQSFQGIEGQLVSMLTLHHGKLWWLVATDSLHRGSSDVLPEAPPHKIPSFSGFLNTMESSMSQLKWPNNGYKKLKLIDRLPETDTTLPLS